MNLLSSFFSKYTLVQKELLFYNSAVRGSKKYVVEIIAISHKSTVRTQDNGLNNTNSLIWSLLKSMRSCPWLQWPLNQVHKKWIPFVISSWLKTWYFNVEYIVTKKSPDFILSGSSIPVSLSRHKWRRCFCGSYRLCAAQIQGLYCSLGFGFRCWGVQLILDTCIKWMVERWAIYIRFWWCKAGVISWGANAAIWTENYQ